MRWIKKKMIHIFFDGLDELYLCAKFGEVLTFGKGCGCENVVFVFFGHAPSPEHCAVEGYIVRTSIALPFIGRF